MTGRLALADALGATSARALHLIGAGGKTTVMYALAAELAARGRRVITTTSTRILRPLPQPDDPESILVDPSIGSIIHELGAQQTWRRRVVAAADEQGTGKLIGHSRGELDRLVNSGVADHVIVEADGAAGRPIKAHRSGEPVIARTCDRVVAVVGLSCLGRPLDERHVHRSGLAAKIARAAPGVPVSPTLVEALLLAPGGWLSLLPSRVPVEVLLASAAGTEPALAEHLARRLVADPRVHAVHVAELKGRVRFVRSV
jgi:probable selenium-dependent hydroxylase accessory protein YqeC